MLSGHHSTRSSGHHVIRSSCRHVNIIISSCHHAIMSSVSNFCSLLVPFFNFWQSMVRQLLARFRNFWYLLATPATFLIFCTFLPILVHIGNFCHNVILSSHPVISSCHLLLSSPLVISSCHPVFL